MTDLIGPYGSGEYGSGPYGSAYPPYGLESWMVQNFSLPSDVMAGLQAAADQMKG